MRVVVVGNGKVGRSIVEQTRREGHEVIIIDNDPENIEDIIDEFDVNGIVGNGASYQILKSANASKADIVIAATSSDETNILTCLVAKKIGAKSTVARVRSYEYLNQLNLISFSLLVLLLSLLAPLRALALSVLHALFPLLLFFAYPKRTQSKSKNIPLLTHRQTLPFYG